jgi:hypothetical protein
MCSEQQLACLEREEQGELKDCMVTRGFASRYGSHTAPKKAASAPQSSGAEAAEAITSEPQARRYPRFPGASSSGTTGKTPREAQGKKRRISFSKMFSLSLPRRRSSPLTFGNRLLSRTL